MRTILAEIQTLETKLAAKGPRGGNIIGKTRSGKPIYDTHNHPTHKDFTVGDHHDAAKAHERLQKKHDSQAYKHMEKYDKMRGFG